MNVYIVDAKRTAIGSFMGSLSNIGAAHLGAEVIKNIISNNKLEKVDEVIMGQVLIGGLGQNPARQAAIYSNLPINVPAHIVSMVCGSGLKSIATGVQAIKSQDSDIVICGGQENMSLGMHAIYLRNGVKMGKADFTDMMMYDGITDVFSGAAMGITAENIASKFGITRDQQDEFAVQSQYKASQAIKSGKFKDEIIPIEVKSKKEVKIFDTDEFVKHDTSLETLQKLKPAFLKDGTVTAGNASGINDGAAAVLIANEDVIKKHNLNPIARIVSYGQSGVSPDIMGTGPIDAVKNALAKANWSVSDLDLIESNEAFAAQAICVNKHLGWNLDIVNVNGGAIALGHPIGASGTRVMVSLIHEMRRRKAQKGIATLCIGGGMGIAMCVELV